ncbi:hypothetical protein JZU46_02810 [bacterium]|nr:hypothetical protein [bacterium]
MSGGILKRTSFKNGRGYCGYHTTWDDKLVFCRSMLEKIQCILLDKEKVFYLMEKQIYVINDDTYKPDFFIYTNGDYKNLHHIIEIKDTQKECNLYLNLYKYFFNSLGITYSVFTYNRNYYKKHVDFKDILEDYIKNSDSYNMSGKNNPAYGVVFSEPRMQQHRLSMIECQSREDVRKRRSVSMKLRYAEDPALVKLLSVKQSKYQESLRIQKYGQKKQNVCMFCGGIVDTYDKLDKLYCKKTSCKGSWCNYKAKLNGTSGHLHTEEAKNSIMYNLLLKHGLKLQDIYNEINTETVTLYKNTYCRKNSRFSIKSIIKYYITLELYIQKIKEVLNENN